MTKPAKEGRVWGKNRTDQISEIYLFFSPVGERIFNKREREREEGEGFGWVLVGWVGRFVWIFFFICSDRE
jgi:hypothetical protein